MPKLNDYHIIAHLAPGLIVTSHWRYGNQLWSLSKMTKKHLGDECVICGQPVGAKAFRPVTNLSNRMMRMCAKHENDAPQ